MGRLQCWTRGPASTHQEASAGKMMVGPRKETRSYSKGLGSIHYILLPPQGAGGLACFPSHCSLGPGGSSKTDGASANGSAEGKPNSRGDCLPLGMKKIGELVVGG